jgi:hypothetical protein
VAELYALFTQVTDPRRPRGVGHRLATVLTVAVFAVLAGARNFREVGDRAADLPRLLLDAAGARRDPRTGDLVASSGSTLRRVVEDIDADAMDRLICQWLANRACPRHGTGDEAPGQHRRGIVMDGKVVRNSGAGHSEDNVKLFSAMLHDQAVVIAQIRIPEDTNEITQVVPLLDQVDLAGTVVTGDAAHLARDPRCTVAIATLDFDLVVEGTAEVVTDRDTIGPAGRDLGRGRLAVRGRRVRHRPHSAVQRTVGRRAAVVGLPRHRPVGVRRRHGRAGRRHSLDLLKPRPV